MYGTEKGIVKATTGLRGFGFIKVTRGDVTFDIFVHEHRLKEGGWKAEDFRLDETVDFDYEIQSDGRYRLTKLHQIGSRMAPAYYKLTVVDRDKEQGLSIVKVFDLSLSCTLGFRVLDKNEGLLGNYPTLVAARASIGRVIQPPRDVNHGRKTNVVVQLEVKEKKKKAA